jgi:polyhydroxyalkanoate synthesis regulator phasin
MKDIIEKSINLGLGIAATTKEKVDCLVDEMIQKGYLARGEKPKAVQEIFDRIEKSEIEFKEKTREVVNDTLNNTGFATKKDINDLKETISGLQKIISAK